MSESREELLQELNNKLAVQGTTQESREIIGLLYATIQALGEEIDTLEEELAKVQDQMEEVEDIEKEQKRRKWYSER